MRAGKVSRRSFMHLLTALAAGAAAAPVLQACSPASPVPTATQASAAAPTQAAAPATTPAPKVPAAPGKLAVWLNLTFTNAHKVTQEAAQAWGKENNYTVVVTPIEDGDLPQKISAGIEANVLPDISEFDYMMLQRLTSINKVVEVSDLYDKVGAAQGGWMKGIQLWMDPKNYKPQKGYWGIPYHSGGNILNWRQDVLEATGQKPPAKTWFEMADMAEKAQKPGKIWGMGLSLAQERDANQQITIMQTFGARVADDAGKKVTLQSPEALEYLKWIDDCYTNRKIFPPGVLTWDGTGDNNSYQSGQAVFILNPGSVYRWMQENDKEMLAGTRFGAWPAGPKMKLAPFQFSVRGIMATTKDADGAKRLVERLISPEVMSKNYLVDNQGPVLNGQKSMEAFKDVFLAGLLDMAENGTPIGYPDIVNTAWSEFNNQFVVPKMIQRVLVDKWSHEKALEEAHNVATDIYAKNA